MGFIAISIEKLRVGLYIKLDHSWAEHPFVRNTFQITSDNDVAIIKKHRLWKIFYDPDKSDPDAIHALEFSSPLLVEEPSQDREDSLHVESQEETTLKQGKAERIEAFTSQQKALNQTRDAYLDGIHQSESIMRKVSAGAPEGLEFADQVVGSMTNLLQGTSPAMTLVTPPIPVRPGDEIYMESMNVSALSLLLGRTLQLNQTDAHTLGLGALFHNLGLHRIPANLRAKKGPLKPAEKQVFEMYPQHAKAMLEQVPGVSRNVIEIVHQHRENLDGSGFPQGLSGKGIGFLPRLVRVVIEYHNLTSQREASSNLSPTEALSHLYVKMKAKCDFDVIQAFIATVTVYPPGSYVQLSDGSVGVVVKTNEQDRMRPLLLLYEEGVSQDGDLILLDLAGHKELSIEKSLDSPSKKISDSVGLNSG